MEEPSHLTSLAALLDALPFPAGIVDTEGQALYLNRVGGGQGGAGDKRALAAAQKGCQALRQRGLLDEASQRRQAVTFTEEVSGANGERCRLRRLCVPIVTSNGKVDQFAVITVGCATTPGTLSGREREVFDFLGHGLTTQQIAERLDVSPKTVESYRARIKSKLEIDHHTELLRRAVQWVEGSNADHPEAGASSTTLDVAWLDDLVREIRSPLAAIVGMADTLASDDARPAGDIAALISKSTQQLIQRLDVLSRDALRYDETDEHNGRNGTGKPRQRVSRS